MINESGNVYGRLKVVARHGTNRHGKATWLCECECGNSTIVDGGLLRSGRTQSCGCLHKESVAKIGRRNAGTTRGSNPKYLGYEDELHKVIRVTDSKHKSNGRVIYECECKKCGGVHLRDASHLKRKSHSRECPEFKAHNASGLDRRDAIIRRVYGITLEEYEAKLEEQGGVCEICGKPDEVEGRRMAIDHDHDTGAVRGLLCGTCNRGLGSFMDDIETLKKATAYLIKYSNAR